MSNASTRRSFFKSCTVGAGVIISGFGTSLNAVEPMKRIGAPRLLLGLAAYSFRDYFIHASHKRETQPDATKQIDMLQFIDYCAEQGCQGAELTSYYFSPDVTAEYLLEVKRHAFMRGVEITGTAVGNTFTYTPGKKRDGEIATVKRWIDNAQLLGAPHLRVFAGNAEKQTKEEAKRLCIAALEECADHASKKGVVLGIENHGGIVAEADDLLDIVQTVKSPWVGINLDTANFHTKDPYGDLARCAPYAVNVQLKLEIQKKASSKEAADLPRLIQILRDARYQGYVTLEYESAENPWKAVPVALKRLRELLSSAS